VLKTVDFAVADSSHGGCGGGGGGDGTSECSDGLDDDASQPDVFASPGSQATPASQEDTPAAVAAVAAAADTPSGANKHKRKKSSSNSLAKLAPKPSPADAIATELALSRARRQRSDEEKADLQARKLKLMEDNAADLKKSRKLETLQQLATSPNPSIRGPAEKMLLEMMTEMM
jgi:hypothetical protein